MKEKITKIFKNLFNVGKCIFNMSLLTFTVVFAWAYYVHNPIVLLISAFSLSLTIFFSIRTGTKLDIWLFIRSFCLLKLLLLCTYIESSFMLCVNDINKAVVDTTLHIGNNFNIPHQTSLNCLESVGAVTLFFGSMYLAHRVLNYYSYKSGPEVRPRSGSGSGSNSPNISQPIFSEGPVRVDRATSINFSEVGSESNSPIISQPIFSEGTVRVDRATSPVPSEFFESALSGPRSTSSSISESAISIGRCSSPEIVNEFIGLVDRRPSPGVSDSFPVEELALDSARSVSSLSNSSHFSPYPDTLSAPGLETIRTEDSIVSWNSFCRSTSSSEKSVEPTVEPTDVIMINFSQIYNNLPILNFGVESYSGTNLSNNRPNVGSSEFLEQVSLDTTIKTLISQDFREFAVQQNEALFHYLENVYKIGFCIQAIIQNIDNKSYFAHESILIDLANTYKLIHNTLENNNIHVMYSCNDIIHKILPKVKNYIIEEAKVFNYPVEIALVEFEHFECLYKGLHYYSNNSMPLSPFQYHKYSEALNFVNGVIRKDRNYTELINKVTDRDLTILELTFRNFELSGLSISNCLSVFKVAAFCLFNVNLGPIDDIDTVVEKFLSHKQVNMPNNFTIKTDDAFVEINTQAENKENYYKEQLIEKKPCNFIGEIDGYYDNDENKEDDNYDDQYNSNYENDDDDNR